MNLECAAGRQNIVRVDLASEPVRGIKQRDPDAFQATRLEAANRAVDACYLHRASTAAL